MTVGILNQEKLVSLKMLKHNLSFLFFVLILAGCGKIDDVRNSAGNCTDDFTVAYNKLEVEFLMLDSISATAERNEQIEKIEDECEVFFETFAEGIECNATRNNKEVSVGSADFRPLCNNPRRYQSEDLPEPLD